MSDQNRKDSNETLTSNVHSYSLHQLSNKQLSDAIVKAVKIIGDRKLYAGYLFARSKGATVTEFAEFLTTNRKSPFYGNTKESIYIIIRKQKEE